MATVDAPVTPREEVGLLVDLADPRYVTATVSITSGAPIVAFVSGDVTAMFFVPAALGAFWVGLDFFFKFVLGSALDASPPEAAGAVKRQLTP